MTYSLAFYVQVIHALDEIGAPYMIVGAFGGLAFGIVRTTYDIDILVDLHDADFDALAQKFPLPRYYADPEMMRSSVEMGIMFNIIDTSEGIKADLVPLRREPGYEIAFQRRIRREFVSPTGETFSAWVAQPTDIILGKLQAWNEGRSAKHPSDIYSMLVFDLRGLSDIAIDIPAVTQESIRISPEAFALWTELLARANQQSA